MTDWKSRYRLISTGYIRLGLRTNPLSPDVDWAFGVTSDERGGFRQSQWLSGERVMDILSKSSSCLRRSFLYSSISNVRREDNISGNRMRRVWKKSFTVPPWLLGYLQNTVLHKLQKETRTLLLLTSLSDFVSITPPQIKSLFRPLILHIFRRCNKHKRSSTNSCSSVTNICSGGVLKFVFSL